MYLINVFNYWNNAILYTIPLYTNGIEAVMFKELGYDNGSITVDIVLNWITLVETRFVSIDDTIIANAPLRVFNVHVLPTSVEK